MSLHQFKNYLRHFFQAKSTKGHGIHSPFVYELATQVLPDSKHEQFQPIERLRKKLLKDQRVITVTDLGSGSKKHESNKRTIADIAEFSAKSDSFGRMLNRLTDLSGTKRILELGTSLGLSTAYLSLSEKPVITIEGCPEIAKIASANFNHLDRKNIDLRVGDFKNVLPRVLQEFSDINLVFIDGNHSYPATIEYYRMFSEHLPDGSTLIFDDIYWSRGMTRAWQEIVSNHKNQVTIDLFHAGLVFFRKDQAREHFKIRL